MSLQELDEDPPGHDEAVEEESVAEEPSEILEHNPTALLANAITTSEDSRLYARGNACDVLLEASDPVYTFVELDLKNPENNKIILLRCLFLKEIAHASIGFKHLAFGSEGDVYTGVGGGNRRVWQKRDPSAEFDHSDEIGVFFGAEKVSLIRGGFKIRDVCKQQDDAGPVEVSVLFREGLGQLRVTIEEVPHSTVYPQPSPPPLVQPTAENAWNYPTTLQPNINKDRK